MGQGLSKKMLVEDSNLHFLGSGCFLWEKLFLWERLSSRERRSIAAGKPLPQRPLGQKGFQERYHSTSTSLAFILVIRDTSGASSVHAAGSFLRHQSSKGETHGNSG